MTNVALHRDANRTFRVHGPCRTLVFAIVLSSYALAGRADIVVEAQACAAPVIAFNVGGLSEIVTHKKTGYLAKPFSVKDLANGISWVLKNNHIKKLNNQSKLQVIKNFSNEKISKSYLKVYKKSIINYRLNKNTLVVK